VEKSVERSQSEMGLIMIIEHMLPYENYSYSLALELWEEIEVTNRQTFFTSSGPIEKQ